MSDRERSQTLPDCPNGTYWDVQVLRKLRKLQWAENEPYLVRKLLHAARGKVGAAPLVASLTAGLARCIHHAVTSSKPGLAAICTVILLGPQFPALAQGL